jgi:hypothetical protein
MPVDWFSHAPFQVLRMRRTPGLARLGLPAYDCRMYLTPMPMKAPKCTEGGEPWLA